MKKRLKPVIITLVILAALTGGGIYFLTRDGGKSSQFAGRVESEQSDQSEDRAYNFEIGKTAVELQLSGDKKNVLNFDNDGVFRVDSSTAARERLDRVIKKKDVSFEEPLIAANPFGTNENSFYFYFTTSYRGMVRYTITVEDESIPDHVRYVDNGQENNLATDHEFVVSGLVPGMTNYIILEVLDSTGAGRDKRTYVYTPSAAGLSSKLAVEKGKSKELCENGLFFLFPKGDKNIYMYDNSGILRNVVATESGHGGRFYQSGDSAIYQVSDTKAIKVSAIGRVTGVAEIKGYGAIRDFGYDGYDNIYCLVRKKKRDVIVASSFSSGKTKKVYTFPKGVKAHSLMLTEDGGGYISCDKPAGIMKMEALASTRPSVSFILGKKADWKAIAKNDKRYKKKVKEDDTVIHWDTAGAVLNSKEADSSGTKTAMSTYLVDHNKGTGMLFTVDSKEKKVEVATKLPTNQGEYAGGYALVKHFVLSDMNSGIYTEYDEEGKVVKKFSLGQGMTGIAKMTLNQMCFYNGK